MKPSHLPLLLSLALAACGGASGPPAQAPATSETTAEIQAEQIDEAKAMPDGSSAGEADGSAARMPARSAVRFLNQASFGATDESAATLQVLWRWGWLQQQFQVPVGSTHWDRVRAAQAAYLAEDGSRTEADLKSALWDWTIWQTYLTAPDQLRKRMGYVWSQILVTSMEGFSFGGKSNPLVAAAYLDVLERHAFGNFRELLEDVSLSPAMGVYLSHRGNRKADYDAQGKPLRVPDENYARELMQLFTIGLVQLHPDGTAKLKDGQPQPTYTQDDVSQLARVFTGWDLARPTGADAAERLRLPMQHIAARHSPEEKRFLGVLIPARTDGPTSLRIALDALFQHPNVGPFIGRQLIQRLVTSNPSPAYVARVAARFDNDGTGVRGNLRAVTEQVLRDPEARSPLNITQPAPSWGKLREPVLRFTQMARAFGIQSSGPLWRIGDLSDPARELGQSPLRAPSVFNFYRPGYVPPHTSLATAHLVAPEFQITTDTSVPGIVNALQAFMKRPPPGLSLAYSAELPLATNPAALVARMDLILANGALGASTRSDITAAIVGLPAGTEEERLNRVRTAALLTLAAPEFIVQK